MPQVMHLSQGALASASSTAKRMLAAPQPEGVPSFACATANQRAAFSSLCSMVQVGLGALSVVHLWMVPMPREPLQLAFCNSQRSLVTCLNACGSWLSGGHGGGCAASCNAARILTHRSIIAKTKMISCCSRPKLEAQEI